MQISPEVIKAFEKATKDLLAEVKAQKDKSICTDRISIHVTYDESINSYKIQCTLESGIDSGWCWSVSAAFEYLKQQSV